MLSGLNPISNYLILASNQLRLIPKYLGFTLKYVRPNHLLRLAHENCADVRAQHSPFNGFIIATILPSEVTINLQAINLQAVNQNNKQTTNRQLAEPLPPLTLLLHLGI
jgi:hypothetical protein